MRGAKGERQRSGAVAVTVGALRSAVCDLARLRNGTLNRVKIFANIPTDGDAEDSLLERGAKSRE